MKMEDERTNGRRPPCHDSSSVLQTKTLNLVTEPIIPRLHCFVKRKLINVHPYSFSHLFKLQMGIVPAVEETQTRSGPRRLEKLEQDLFSGAGAALPVATHCVAESSH